MYAALERSDVLNDVSLYLLALYHRAILVEPLATVWCLKTARWGRAQ